MYSKYYICKNISVCLIVLIITLFSISPATGDPVISQEKNIHLGSSDTIRKAIDETIAKVRPAIVRIFAVSVVYQNGREVKYESVGSGVIITGEGHVITNHHVVGKAKRIICALSDKKEIPADLVGTDPLTDISVIKLRTNGKEYPYAKFGDSSFLKAGDYVMAMGSPYALSQSVTMGIVSNTEIIIPRFLWPSNRITIEGEDVGSIVKWIGHDAPIYGGNSGGPLVNLNGEIVGINEISLGISGAIPGNLAKDVSEKILQFGRVPRSWIGFEVQPLFKYSKHERGVIVSGTIEGSPAEKAGFMPGDILISLDGKEITVRFQEEIPLFNKLVMELPIARQVKAVVLRKGMDITLSVITEEREYVRPETMELKQWGITARSLSRLNAIEMNRKNKDGIFVTSIRVGGPCWEAKPKISEKDVIIEVNGEQIKNVQELLEITNKLTRNGEGPSTVVVTFERKEERHLTVVRLDAEKERQKQGFEVRKAWLPVATQVLTKDIAKELGIPGITGMRITQIYANRSAEKAGLKVGDIITGLDGDPINITSPEDSETFPAMIRQYKIGSTVELAVVRNKVQLKIPAVLEELPSISSEMDRYAENKFEFAARDIAFIDRAQEGWNDEQKGVLVESVTEGGWASIARLGVGDIIQTIDGEPIMDVFSLEKKMKDILNKKPNSVLFQVRRGIHTFYIELEPIW